MHFLFRFITKSHFMKKYVLFIILLTAISVFGQEKLLVKYEQVSYPTMYDTNGKEIVQSPEMKKYFSKPVENFLTIDGKIGQYYKIEKLDNSQSSFKINMIGGIWDQNREFDFDKNEIHVEYMANNKPYILVDTIARKNDYQLTRETKKLLGYEVKKAERKTEKATIVVWYAPSLPARFGPDRYINFPGLVLSVQFYMNGKTEPVTEILATSVEFNDKLKPYELKKGKIINKTELNKMIQDDEIRQKEELIQNQGVDKD